MHSYIRGHIHVGLATPSVHGNNDVGIQALINHLSLVRPQTKRLIFEVCTCYGVILSVLGRDHGESLTWACWLMIEEQFVVLYDYKESAPSYALVPMRNRRPNGLERPVDMQYKCQVTESQNKEAGNVGAI
jgi:hypothetical protein